MAHSNHHWVVRIEVLGIEFVLIWYNLGTTIIAITFLHFLQFVFHYLFAKLRIVEYRLQIIDLLHQLIIFSVQLIHTQIGKLAEAHVDNCFRLQLVKIKAFLQVTLGIGWRLAATDNVNYLIYIVTGDDKTFQNVCTLLGFLQVKLCATDGNLMTMFNIIVDTFL